MKSIFTVLFLFSTILSGFSQSDSVKIQKPPTKHFLKQQILPLSLITAGALLNIGNIKETVHDHTPMTDNNIDDYLQYVPAAEMYLFDACGIKHQNTVFNQTKYLLISQLAASIITHSLKKITDIDRPTGAPESFPSGHTTFAFVNATVLFHEFKDTDPWIAYSGFVVATATGCLRLTNNAHWLPDVVAGAGIGMLTANVVYWLEPLKKLQIHSGKNKVSFIPMVGYKSAVLVCNF
jgi:membrane-associated PAP2 superfamily phosphatase